MISFNSRELYPYVKRAVSKGIKFPLNRMSPHHKIINTMDRTRMAVDLLVGYPECDHHI